MTWILHIFTSTITISIRVRGGLVLGVGDFEDTEIKNKTKSVSSPQKSKRPIKSRKQQTVHSKGIDTQITVIQCKTDISVLAPTNTIPGYKKNSKGSSEHTTTNKSACPSSQDEISASQVDCLSQELLTKSDFLTKQSVHVKLNKIQRDYKDYEIGKGLVNYNCSEIGLMIGVKSGDIIDTLGYIESEWIVHRDNLVVSISEDELEEML